jgi:hypothetical protein
LVLLSWIIVIVYSKWKRMRWKRSTSLHYSNELYSYIYVAEEKKKPSRFASVLETSVHLEQVHQETFHASVPKTQTDDTFQVSEMKKLQRQGHIADPRELLSDRYTNIKSADDTSAHAVVTFHSPQRGNLPNKSFARTQRQYLTDENAKDSPDEPQRRGWDRRKIAASISLSPQFSISSYDGAVGGSRLALDALARELSNKTTISNSHDVLVELSARLQACGVSTLSDLKGMCREDMRASVSDAQLTPLQFTKLFHACA